MPDFMFDTISLLQQERSIFIACAAIFGLMIGSFLNVVIHRLPKMMEHEWQRSCNELHGKQPASPSRYNLLLPRSACPQCGHIISAMENIPLLSYLWLRGKCAGCNLKISMRYPMVELLTGIVTAMIAWRFGLSMMAVAAWIFAFALIALTFIDFDTQLLPDSITLPLLWLGLLFNLTGGFASLSSAVIGAMLGYLILWSIYWLFKLVTGKEGMGYGDFKLLAAIGAWFGWQLLPAVILLSSVAGSVIGIALIIFNRQGRNVPIPFGPFLALGGIAALFWGSQLSGFYLGA